MKRIGILSFHGAHNYGSMLQNYALQQALMSISPNIEPITINLRNKAQDDMYNIFKPFRDYTDKKRYLFKVLMSPWRKDIAVKQNLFEKFLSEHINITARVASSEEISSLPKMNAYIVGSDQIWNFTAHDFDWAYFLDFLSYDTEVLKIAYAPSMGPNPNVNGLTIEERKRAKRLITEFNTISVREKKTAEAIKELGDLNYLPTVCPDPTLLLSKEEWDTVIESTYPLQIKDYIFLYNPYYLKDVYDQAQRLSELTKMPVIVSNLSPKSIFPSYSFIKNLKTGPIEFLNLVKNAKYVIGRSFHLAVFSMIFNKKFIAVNGIGDSRLNNFLSRIEMNVCASNDFNLHTVVQELEDLDFSHCNRNLLSLRKEGKDFLINSLKDFI